MSDLVIDSKMIESLVLQAVESNILASVEKLIQDPVWLAKVEKMITQTVTYETVARFGSIDVGPVIKQRVDENMQKFTDSVLKNFTSTGIVDQATKCEIAVIEDGVVVENCLTAKDIEAVNSIKVQNLVVTGSINTDNQSWTALANEIGQRTLKSIESAWTQKLVDQVVQQVQDNGISFDQVLVGGKKLVDGNVLSSSITESNLQGLGTLKSLSVKGSATFNENTFNVLNKRVGINTDAPEKALSVWDEEVSVVIGKHKMNQAYIGTNREQSVAIGVNREPQLEIGIDGLVKIKQLQIGLHKISHAPQVPGWSGTRGDLVINSNPGPDRVFAWICLGAYKWQTIKSAP